MKQMRRFDKAAPVEQACQRVGRRGALWSRTARSLVNTSTMKAVPTT